MLLLFVIMALTSLSSANLTVCDRTSIGAIGKCVQIIYDGNATGAIQHVRSNMCDPMCAIHCVRRNVQCNACDAKCVVQLVLCKVVNATCTMQREQCNACAAMCAGFL